MEHDSSNFLPSQKILVQWNEKIDGIHLFTLCLHGEEGKVSGCKNVALISRNQKACTDP